MGSDFEPLPAWHQVCTCGRTFCVPQAFTHHKNSCRKTKKRLASALERAREVWVAKKRRKVDGNTALEGSSMPVNISFGSVPIAPMPTQDTVRLPSDAALLVHDTGNYLPSRTILCSPPPMTWTNPSQNVGVAETIAGYPSATGICCLTFRLHCLHPL
jgi:hypothetical protein